MVDSQANLTGTPTDGKRSAERFYEGAAHKEALARLQYLIDQHRRLGLLVGESGSGKTELLTVFAQRMANRAACIVRLNLTGLSGEELPWLLADQLRVRPRRGAAPSELWQCIADRMVEFRYQQRPAVVLLDDMPAAGVGLHDAILRMLHLDTSRRSPLTVVAAVRPQQVEMLPSRLVELVELRIDLYAWEHGDTEQYLQARLSENQQHVGTFSPNAVQRLHELANGIPRRVHQLTDLALLASSGDHTHPIEAATVENVYAELLVPTV